MPVDPQAQMHLFWHAKWRMRVDIRRRARVRATAMDYLLPYQ